MPAKMAVNGRNLSDNIDAGHKLGPKEKKSSTNGISLPKIAKSEASSNWRRLKKGLGIKSNAEQQSEQVDGSSTVAGLQDTNGIPGRRIRVIAIDCEMVGVGPDGKEDALGRVSIVDDKLNCLLDVYVLPEEPVVDYRTFVSGLDETILAKHGQPFSEVQAGVAEIMNKKIIVGHSIHHDLSALRLDHPRKRIRDTQKYKPFRQMCSGAIPSLRRLALAVLNRTIQQKSHCSVEDARTAMRLYLSVRKEWETSLRAKRGDGRGTKVQKGLTDCCLKGMEATVNKLSQPPVLANNKAKHLRCVAKKKAQRRRERMAARHLTHRKEK